MLRLITRHAQVIHNAKFIDSHLYPDGEYPLSELGREQAALLGKRLKAQGFKGKILASPYMRTLETADIIAKETGLFVIPFAPLREIFRKEEQIAKYQGLTLAEMREKYSRIDPNAKLEYPWWTPDIETNGEVLERMREAIKIADESFGDEEILFVGHGASANGLTLAYGIEKTVYPFTFNCALSYIDPENSSISPVFCDTAHLPYEKTTSNGRQRETFDAEYFTTPYEEEIELPDGIGNMKGSRVLHIGDTYSRDYPFIKKLIDEVKPDVIIHTGDIADEVKVGRIPHTRYEYKYKIKFILDTLKDSGARVIIVPGNNDVKDDIQEIIPSAEIYSENSVVAIDGVECRIGHQVTNMTFDKKWAFYGHGFRDESWDYSMNKKGGECRFNACFDSYVCSLTDDEFYNIHTPKAKKAADWL